MRIVAFGSFASNLITSSAMLFNFDLASVAGTTTLPWNDFALAGVGTGPGPVGLVPVPVAGVEHLRVNRVRLAQPVVVPPLVRFARQLGPLARD